MNNHWIIIPKKHVLYMFIKPWIIVEYSMNNHCIYNEYTFISIYNEYSMINLNIQWLFILNNPWIIDDYSEYSMIIHRLFVVYSEYTDNPWIINDYSMIIHENEKCTFSAQEGVVWVIEHPRKEHE